MAANSLKQLAESKTEGIQKATFFKVDPRKLVFETGFNLREEGEELNEHIERLYAAMKEGAYIPPIDVSVKDGEIIIRDGHCRTRAALRLVDEGVAYLLEARQIRGNEIDHVIHMLGSDQGRKFSSLEQGRGFLRLINYGMEVADISKKTGLHRSTIENGLMLANAPVAIHKLITDGKVAPRLALDTIREHGSAAEQVLVRAIDNAEQAGKTKATKKHIDKPKSKPAAILLIDEAVSIIESWTDAHALKEAFQEWTPKAKAVLEKHA